MKKQLKLMSLVLSIALLLISAAPITANAFDSIDMDDNAELITPSSDAIYSIRAADASVELCRALAEMNISIQNNTLIEVVPLIGEAGGTAIEITNAVNNTVTKDMLVATQNDGTIANLTIESPNTVSTNETGSAYFPNYSNSLIHTTVTYDYYTGGFYRPRSVQFVYTSNGVDTVTNVDIQYICQGHIYTYPGLEGLAENDYDVYSHVINIFKTTPESGVAYSFSRPYRSDRVIHVSLEPPTSHYVNFSVYVNNERICITQLIYDGFS